MYFIIQLTYGILLSIINRNYMYYYKHYHYFLLYGVEGEQMNSIKKLNVLPFHDNFAHCLDECIISAAKYYGRNFILMYSQAWGFSFIEKLMKNNMSYWLDADRGQVYDLLRLYHGIRVTFSNKIESNKVKNIIINELIKNNPVGVLMDTYYYSWDPNKNQHGRHWFLITGVDTEKALFYCTDPYFQQKNAILEFKDFIDGYLGVYFTFSLVKDEILDYDWKSIIDEVMKKINGINEERTSIFNNMIEYADYLEKSICLTDEFVENGRIIDMPFYINLQAISRGRLQYALFLENVASKYSVDEFFEIAEKLKYVSSKWDVIRGIMVKSIITKNKSMIQSRIPPKIREISNYEKDIFNLMANINTNTVCPRNITMNDTAKNSNDFKSTNDFSKFVHIDLTEYFNNNCFGSIDTKTKSNLNGTGLYFIAEDIPREDIWVVGGMKFKVTNFREDLNDNISCSEQLIQVPSVNCNNLMILATADFGNFNELITLYYSDGRTEQISIGVTEFIFEPMYGEVVAWEGRACIKTRNTLQIHNSKVKIFAKNYRLTTPGIVTHIALPYLPNIHIFAMTMT